MDPRWRFLETLEQPLQELAPGGRLEYREGAPFPGVGLSLAVPGHEGGVHIVAFSLSDNTKVYTDPFPGSGVPHWELYAVDDKGNLGESVVSCRRETILRAFTDWLRLRAPTPDLRAGPPALDHLNRIGRTLAPKPPTTLRGEGVAAAAGLPTDERQRFEADISALAGSRIARFFPRADDGRAAPGTLVLLTAYGPEEKRRRLWLNIAVTRTRSLEIGLTPLVGENNAHRWDGARWLWDSRVAMPSREERWGIDPSDPRVGPTLELLDQGRFGEALETWGIGWASEVALVAAAKPLSMHDATLADRWAEALRRELWELAPWRLPSALPPPTRGSERLFTLPGQRNLRKASLMLSRTPRGLDLRLEYTGTNSRLPQTAFKRLVEHDLVRLGILDTDLPDPEPLEHTDIHVAPPQPVDAEKEIVRLAAKLRHLEGDGYKAAVRTGRRLGQELAAGPLIEAIRDRDPRVRQRALQVATELAVTACGAPAFERLDDQDRLVRSAAADLLRRVRYGPALLAIARRMLTRTDDYLIGATTLRNWGEKAGNDALRTHLASADSQIRAAACLAVVQYGGKALVLDLLRLALEDEPLVASAALRALEVLDPNQLATAEASVAGRRDASEVERARSRWQSYRRY